VEARSERLLRQQLDPPVDLGNLHPSMVTHGRVQPR
jgi:hypothetical protein